MKVGYVMKGKSFFDEVYSNGIEGWGFHFRRSQLFRFEKCSNLVKSIIDIDKEFTVLDIACGDGFFSNKCLTSFAKKVLGVDISEIAIKNARKRYPKLELLCDSLPYLEKVSGSYDFISVNEVLYYLPYNEQLMSLQRIGELCNEKGYILVTVNIGPSPYYTKGEIRSLLNKFFVIIKEDDLCLKWYSCKVEEYLVRGLMLFQKNTWDRCTASVMNNSGIMKMILKRAAYYLFSNKVAYLTYNRICDSLIRKILFYMPISLIDMVSRKVSYEKNLSVYIALCKKK